MQVTSWQLLKDDRAPHRITFDWPGPADDEGFGRNPLSVVPVASSRFEPLALRQCVHSRAVLRRLWHDVEHVFNTWAVSGLQPPVEVDVVPSLCPVVSALGLVRER